MQQVRAEVKRLSVDPFEYVFERERKEWSPKFSDEKALVPAGDTENEAVLNEARGGIYRISEWKLVKGLVAREGSALERDAIALKLASPESGSFVLVSLRRRRKVRHKEGE